MDIAALTQKYATFPELIRDLENPKKRFRDGSIDARVKSIFDDFAEYRAGLPKITPKAFGTLVKNAKKSLAEIGEVSKLENFREFLVAVGCYVGQVSGFIPGYSEVIKDKLLSGDENWTQADLDCIVHGQDQESLQDLIMRIMKTTENRRLLYTTVSLFQEQGLDKNAIDLVLKTSRNMTNTDIYHDRALSGEGALVYQLVVLDIVKNMRANGMDKTIVPVLEAIEQISKADMSMLGSFYLLLETPLGRDPESIRALARNISRFSWIENYRTRFSRDGKHYPEMFRRYEEMLEKYMQGKGLMPMFPPYLYEQLDTIIMNNNLAFSCLDILLITIYEQQYTPTVEEIDLIFKGIRSFVNEDKLDLAYSFAASAPSAAARGIDLEKLEEIWDKVQGLYLPFFYNQLRLEFMDLRDIINSDLLPQNKGFVIENYFVHKRLYHKTRLPALLTDDAVHERYKPATDEEYDKVRNFNNNGLSAFRSLQDIHYGWAFARQMNEILEAGIMPELLHLFINPLKERLEGEKYYFEHITTFAGIMRQGLQDIAHGGIERAVDKICEAAKLLNSWNALTEVNDALTPDELLKIINGMTDAIASKYILDSHEAALLPKVYSVQQRYRLLHTPIYSDSEREMVAALIRSDLGIDKIEKNFPLGQVFCEASISPVDTKLNAAALTYHLVVALTTENDARKEKAMAYFDRKTILRARSYVAAQEGGTKKLYRLLQEDLEILRTTQDARLESASRYNARAILTKISDNYFGKSVKEDNKGDNPNDDLDVIADDSEQDASKRHSPAAQALDDILTAAQRVVNNTLEFDSLQFRMQDGIVDDIQGRNKLTCCALKPYDMRSVAGILYALENNIGLLNITPALQDKPLDPIGIAICLNCTSDDHKPWLAVDTLEGGDALKLVDVKVWGAYALQAIYELGRKQKSRFAVINTKLVNPNSTAEQFVEYISSLGLPLQTITLRMREIPRIYHYGHGKHMLDMFSRDDYSIFNHPDGTVTGIVLDLSKEYDFTRVVQESRTGVKTMSIAK